ncbi:MAG: DoxX family protein [Clostridium sp.]|nr:DoxX family protein [Bacteroides sp.]MCM1199127.1 DoxX family protein [Clostridium sp.]
MGRLYNRFRRFCAFLAGVVFIVSGLLKLLDPVGAGLVVGEYYKFLGLDFLSSSSLPAGVLLALMETFVGIGLATGVWRRIFAAAAMVFTGFFTLLTLILVIFNPSMDCGCFGEAVHLSHWETFIKNLVLCAISAVAFFPFRKLGRPKRRKYVSFAVVGTAAVAFCVYHILYIPVVDFTDFRAGARLGSSVGSSKDVYEAAFIYEKDGKQRRFNLDNLPDSTWTYVSTETEQTGGQEEYIVQLPISDMQGEHHDGIASSGKVIAISVYSPYRLNAGRWNGIAALVLDAYAAGFTPVVLVPEDLGRMEAYLWDRLGHDEASVISSVMYFSDYKTLVTMNRSNGGATYFHDGYLVCKWTAGHYPVLEEYSGLGFPEASEMSAEASSKGQMALQAFLLYVFAVILFI